jgi:hypothetical protein
LTFHLFIYELDAAHKLDVDYIMPVSLKNKSKMQNDGDANEEGNYNIQPPKNPKHGLEGDTTQKGTQHKPHKHNKEPITTTETTMRFPTSRLMSC